MPELPEVETTRRGIGPYVTGREVTRVLVREPRLRWPVSPALASELPGRTLGEIGRRAKYLLLPAGGSTLIVHLGMSGSLRLVETGAPLPPHAHVEIMLTDGYTLRYIDPRRFGAILWTPHDPLHHRLLRNLGVEPLEPSFTGDALYRESRARRVAIKSFIMDARIVVGIGNIYASEALYRAGVHPARAAGRIGRARYERLATAIREVLSEAIAAGGTTLRDFLDGQGRPGYFRQALQVYGRAGRPCPTCGRAVRNRVLGQRSTYYCARCQT